MEVHILTDVLSAHSLKWKRHFSRKASKQKYFLSVMIRFAAVWAVVCAVRTNLEDAVNVVIKKMEECDGLIVGSPVHYAGASGGITSFLDRMFYSTGGFPYKPGAAVVSCRRAGSTAALEQLNKYFMMNNMPLVPSAYWNMVHGNSPEEVEQDLEGLMVMRTLGRNMAWLLKSIDAGKAHGILAPAAEPKTRTNFIRKCEPVKKEDEEKNFAPYFISYNKVNKEYQEEE